MNDLRLAVRQLARHPLFTTVAVLVLGLGIGANSAMFSLINALLFRPLTAHRPEQLVGVYSRELKPQGGYRSFSYPNYLDLRERGPVFVDLAAYKVSMVGVLEGDITRRAFAGVISANFLRTLGVRPLLGRDFTAEEEHPKSGATVALVSHAWWQRQGADPGILDRSLTVNGRPFTIVGVTPEGFTGTTALFAPDLWVPLGAHEFVVNDFTTRRGRDIVDRGNHQFLLLGRLKPGLSVTSANAQLEPLARQLAESYPAENRERNLEVNPLPRLSITTNPQDNRELRGLAALLLPLSGVVLLVACLNLANLLIARGTVRRREFAVRLALGGGRGRILRQLLVEGLLLSLLGGLAGLVLAWLVPHLLAISLAGRLPGMTLVLESRPDVRVVLSTLAFCGVATLLFALAPAWNLARTEVVQSLKDQGALTFAGRLRTGLLAPRNLLVTAQLALSLALLTIACLFFRGAQNAARTNPGFALDDGLLIELDASLAGFDQDEGRARYLAALERLRNLPGVASASAASIVPFGLFFDARDVRPLGGYSPDALRNQNAASGSSGVGIRESGSDQANPDPVENREETVNAGFVIAGRDYLRTVGLPLLKGRDFDRLEEQGASATPVAIVDQPFARRLWGSDDPIGRQFEMVEATPDGRAPVFTVVGVTAGVRQEVGDREANARFYVPLGQRYQSWMNLHVRLAQPGPTAAAAMSRLVRDEIRRVDERLPVISVNTLRGFHDQGIMMWGYRTGVKLFGALAALALFLSAVGVYGVRAYLVERRTREIGIRVALGASRGEVIRLVLREGVKLTASGLGVGALLSLAAGRLLGSRLYEVSWADPFSLGAALLLLGGAALLACWLPARRAAAVDPLQALRAE